MPVIGTWVGIGCIDDRSWVHVIWSSKMSGAGILPDPGEAWPNAGPAARAPNPSAPKAIASKRFRIMSVPLFIAYLPVDDLELCL